MSDVAERCRGAVERYFAAMDAQDWEALAAELTDDGLVRNGPFEDLVEGKEAYVSFLRGIISSLPGYHLEVQRISAAEPDRLFVELTESFQVDGAPHHYPEICVMEGGPDGRIHRVDVFVKHPGSEGPVAGSRAD